MRVEPPGGSIYAERTRYGFWLNINHPDVAAALARYCQRRGINARYPLSDAERAGFEVEYLTDHGIDHQTPEWVRFRYYEIMGRGGGGDHPPKKNQTPGGKKCAPHRGNHL